MTAILLAALVAVQTPAPVQPPTGRPTKPQERVRFHPVRRPGSTAADRDRALALRERKEADSNFAGVKWRCIGPEVESGRVIDLERLANGDLLVAYATGGLWITRDKGLSFAPIFDDKGAFGIGAIAATPDGKTIWVGTGEANSQRTSYAGDGLYKSADGGKTFARVGLTESHHIGDVIIDPKNSDVVYVAALGPLYSQGGERGVYKTTDGGRSWRRILNVDEATGAIDLALDPNKPGRILASMWDRDRRAWNFRESGVGSAVYRSENGGASWVKTTGLPVGDAAGRTGIARSASHPEIAYAFVDDQSDDERWREFDEKVPGGQLTRARLLRLPEDGPAKLDDKVLDTFLKRYPDTKLTVAEAKKLTATDLEKRIAAAYPDAFRGSERGARVFRTADGGRTWTPTGDLGQFGGYYWGKVFVSPTNPDDVMVTGLPLLRSKDGGKTWTSIAEDAHVDHHAVVWEPSLGPDAFWIGNDGGLYLSADGGKTVRHFNSLPVGQATTLAVDDAKPYNVYLGFQDNGTQVGPSTHVPGRNVDEWKSIFGGDGSAIAIDPRKDRNQIYVAYQFGEHFFMDRDKLRGAPDYGPGKPDAPMRRITPATPKGEKTNRFNWISPIVIDPFVPDILYIGSQRLHRSFDQGRTWKTISPDLTRDLPQSQVPGGGDVPFSTLKDVSASPLVFGLIYCGADDGRVTMTPDGGATWRDIPTPTPEKWVSRIVASRHEADVVYCAQSGYRDDDWRAYLYRSTDRGRTWTSISGDLPDETINVIREDPVDPKTLYVGTDMGVWASRDSGATWFALAGGMPNLPVHDLAVQTREDELVIATHARSAWVLPLKPFRQVNPAILAGGLAILDAPTVRRSERWGYESRARYDLTLPDSPKLKATVFAPAKGKATLRLKDKAGKLVKESVVDLEKGWNATELELRLTTPKPVGVSPTDRAKTVEEALADPFSASRATFVAVGDYVLEIEQNGKVVTKNWSLTE